MIASRIRTMIAGANVWAAAGNSGRANRMNPYAPSFSMIAARITEPAVGAWTWASGSQVWTGHIGILTAKLARKASHSQVCASRGKSVAISTGIEVVWAKFTIHSIATSISTEPRRV